ARAEPLAQLRLDGRPLLARRRHRRPAALGERDEAHACVARIGTATDVAEALELGDGLRHRLLGHLERGGEPRDRLLVLDEALDEEAVREAQAGEAARVEAAAYRLRDRLAGEEGGEAEVELRLGCIHLDV